MPLYAWTVFLSASLLFSVQPMVGKFALPWFGGTPAVWTTCMLFFQAVLLAGYAYAHASIRSLPPRRQALLHLGLLGLAVLVLGARALLSGSPIAPDESWKPEPLDAPALRLFLMLSATIGLPFFVLSTTGPLVQSWFGRVHPGRSAYRLYALSNAGSLASLLAFPFLVEPFVSRTQQGLAWSIGFLGFVASCALCARGVLRAPDAPRELVMRADGPRWAGALVWVLLSAIAAVLLLATTQRLSQDVAAGPFLWVLPLALYLLSFMLTFEREGFYRRWLWYPLLFLSILGVTKALYKGPHVGLGVQLLAYGGALLAGCMVCHGELYRRRPAQGHLTAFYLAVSAGGLAGGLFVNLVAPRVFASYAEFPLSVGASGLVAVVVLVTPAVNPARWLRVARLGGGLVFGLACGALALAHVDDLRGAAFSARNFFGRVQVREYATGQPDAHQFVLHHGIILHGMQYAAPALRRRATSYFTAESGLGLAIEAQRLVAGGRALKLGVLGLGVGTSAALAQAGDTLRFYEIDPRVISLAQGEGGYFSYLKDSAAEVSVVEGDARISLERELARGQAQRFDVLALDVFSSDAIPAHLLTAEAMRLYRAHLAQGGVLALHISNLHLDLSPVALGHAEALGFSARLVATERAEGRTRSLWMLLSERPAFFSLAPFLREAARTSSPSELATRRVLWTDERNSVLDVLERPSWRPFQ